MNQRLKTKLKILGAAIALSIVSAQADYQIEWNPEETQHEESK